MTEFEKIAVVFILLWAVPSPDTVFKSENGYTVADGKATSDDTDGKFVYDSESGLLLEVSSSDSDGSMKLENKSASGSFLPINPFFVVLGLLSIPVIQNVRRRKN